MTITVADGRENASAESDVSAWDAHPAVLAAAAAARSHWRAGEGLEDEEFRVMDAAEGAFTEAGAPQTAVLYLMSTTPRCCPRMGLAVVEGDRLVRNVAFDATAQTLRAVPGLADDGRDGLAMGSSFGQGGHNESSVTLAVFEGDALVSLGSTTTAADGCGAMREGGEATRVTVRPGRAFFAQRFTRATCDGPWTPAGPEEPLTLDPPGDSPYVALPAG